MLKIINFCFLLYVFPFAANSMDYRCYPNNSDSLKKVKISLLPSKHLMPLFHADSRAHRTCVTKITEINNYVMGFGGTFPLLDVQYYKNILQFSIAGTVFSQMQRKPGHLVVINTDYFADFYMDASIYKNIFFRIGTGHTSQHLMDDAFEILGYKNSLNYIRDYYNFFLLYKNDKIKSFIYGGIYYNYHFRVPEDISNTMIYETGMSFTPLKFCKNYYAFCGLDIKFRGEMNFQTTQNYQLGIKYMNKSERAVSIAFNHHEGLEERGQFYKNKIRMNTIGLYLDY